jgi:phosphatidylinositol-3-phosphatase
VKNIIGSLLLFVTSALTICCGGGGGGVNVPGIPNPGSGPVVPQTAHVVVVVEENHSYPFVIGASSPMTFLNSLANQHALATNYFANFHPSIDNYFMMTAGQPLAFAQGDGFPGPSNVDNLARELVAANKTWKVYAENLPSVGWTGGDSSDGKYLKHHNPFAYFTDVIGTTQATNLVPFTQFSTDLTNDQLPNFSFIVPNARDDAHDCPDGTQNCVDSIKLSNADAWLQNNIQPLLNNSAFQQDGLLVIVFDESFDADTAHGGGHVAMVMAGTKVKTNFQSTTLYQHQSLLRMIVEATGASAFPGFSGVAPDMAEFFNP